ncbi:MAG: hypothetical protein EOM15_14205 [Spirochaetia bacterium]|nr:hypothetical protein [Spirochaetia bacterium]
MVNHKNRVIQGTLLLIVFLLLFASCTITESLSFKQTGYHYSEFDFSVEEFFIAVLQDFSEFSAPDVGEGELMDRAIEDFERALAYSPTTRTVDLRKTGENSYVGTFEFSNIMRLLSDLGAGENQNLLKVTNNSMTFFLSMDNYHQLVPVIPFLADENFEAFGPVYNQGLSEDDYLEMISFMLGEEGPPAIESSVITLRVNTPTAITSFSNGEKVSEQVYEFSFPLIDFLLLAKPITFSVSWT